MNSKIHNNNIIHIQSDGIFYIRLSHILIYLVIHSKKGTIV